MFRPYRQALLPRGYRPMPRLVLQRLRMTKNAADHPSARVTQSHVVIVLVPMITRTSLASLTSECAIESQARILGSPVMLLVFVAIGGWAFQKPIGFTLVVIGQLAQIPLRRAVLFALRIKQPCQFQ